jgi:hypothetical protein
LSLGGPERLHFCIKECRGNKIADLHSISHDKKQITFDIPHRGLVDAPRNQRENVQDL